MTSRQVGRRMSSIAAERKTVGRRAKSGTRQVTRRKSEPLTWKEKRRLIQLVACGSIFVLLVAVKLLLPGKMAELNTRLRGLLEQNIDVQAVFSAVGRAVSGETDADGALQDVYRAVFQPQEEGEVRETSAQVEIQPQFQEPSMLETLRLFRTGTGDSSAWMPEPAGTEETTTDAGEATAQTEEETDTSQVNVSNLAYVLYSNQNVPENVSLEQGILGFDYCTPVVGTLTSEFGYREHPVEGEEKFHYGIDVGANTGTEIDCFADGTVTAVGESSSYGKYVTVSHEGGYTTLYAHCSKITVSSGAEVQKGEKIAEVGETGIATGPHLHFELQQDGEYLNPIYYVSLV